MKLAYVLRFHLQPNQAKTSYKIQAHYVSNVPFIILANALG